MSPGNYSDFVMLQSAGKQQLVNCMLRSWAVQESELKLMRLTCLESNRDLPSLPSLSQFIAGMKIVPKRNGQG